MKKILILLALIMTLGAVTACGHRAETVDNKIKVNQEPQAIERSIILAARSLGWTVQPIDDSSITATITSRERSLTVLVTYTPQSYIIQYKDSLNLDFDNEDNSISKQYTRWVEALDDRIQEEMERVKDSK